ncbi:uncharacterized protein LOC144447295 [Glandiceps talaboti]
MGLNIYLTAGLLISLCAVYSVQAGNCDFDGFEPYSCPRPNTSDTESDSLCCIVNNQPSCCDEVLAAWAIALIVLAALLFIAIIVGVCACCCGFCACIANCCRPSTYHYQSV